MDKSIIQLKTLALALMSVVCVAVFVSCSDSEDNLNNPPKKSQRILSRSANESSIIDVTTAEYVASKVINAPVDGTEPAQPKKVGNSIAIRNSYDDIVMYAVNFEDNAGFVIISASMKTTPIIAMSNHGCFTSATSSSPLLQQVIEMCISQISRTLNDSDLPVDSYAAYWRPFLPPNPMNSPRKANASNSDYMEIINRIVDKWIYEDKYEVYNALTFCNDIHGKNLPGLADVLRNLTMPVGWADSRPTNELSFIIVRHTPEFQGVSNQCTPVTTNWTTDSPYNAAVPGAMPLSSEAVAVGQLLYYYNDPVIRQFSASAANPLQNNTEIANFLYDVALNIGTVFGSTYSYASFDNMKYALSTYYHYDFESGQYNEKAIMRSIDNGSPSIIIYYDSENRSHAIITDRYRMVTDRIDYFLMAPLGQPEDPLGPYESMGQWDDYGNGSYPLFESEDNNMYFNAWCDLTGDWYANTIYIGPYPKK